MFVPTITQKRHKENSLENPFSRNFSLPETLHFPSAS